MISVRVRYSRAAQANPDLIAKLRQPMILGEAMAKVVSARVKRRGDLATSAKPYAGAPKKGAYWVSDDYARSLGLQESRFRSSAEFHQRAKTKPGTFSVSGGMWQGLQVRNFGSAGVVIDFAGSSLGSARLSVKTKTGRTRTKPVKVRNQDKAATVFRQSGVNVIQPKSSEQEACGAAVCRWSQNMVGKILGGNAGAFSTSADQTMLRTILRLYDGSR